MMEASPKKNFSERYPVPAGFRGLLESLAREVLRAQPTDVFAFSGLFFTTLSDVQARTGRNPVTDGDGPAYAEFKHQLLTDGQKAGLIGKDSPGWRYLGLPPSGKSPESDENRNVLLKNAPSPSQETQDPALEKPTSLELAAAGGEAGGEADGASPRTPEEAAVKIQAAFRGFKVRRDPGLLQRKSSAHALTCGVPQRELVKPLIRRSASLSEAAEAEEGAATRIQAGVRGFLARKRVAKQKSVVTHAATKIQSAFRGFETRKRLDEAGLLSPTRSGGSSRKSSSGQAPPPMDAEAAVKIQAEVRGFLARKELAKEKVAATKIQAAYRGFSTRKDSQLKTDALPSEE